MNKLIRRCGRALAGAFLCGSLLFGTAAAEPAPAIDGMAAFREAVTASESPDDRVFRQDLFFFAPMLRADLNLQGYTKGSSLRILGGLELDFTDAAGVTTGLNFPFYIDEKDKKLTCYFKPDKKWRKYQTPTLPVSIADMTLTPEKADDAAVLSLVREVAVLHETDARRTMLIRLDTDRLADIFMACVRATPSDKGTAGGAKWQDTILDCITKGIRRADIRCTWTVDKKDWRTVTLSHDLSSLVQEITRVALEIQPDCPQDIESYVEAVAYHSDLKSCITFLPPDARKRVVLPEEAKEAVVVEDIVPGGVTDEKEKKK